MDEYDAFGRPVDDDPLRSLRDEDAAPAKARERRRRQRPADEVPEAPAADGPTDVPSGPRPVETPQALTKRSAFDRAPAPAPRERNGGKLVRTATIVFGLLVVLFVVSVATTVLSLVDDVGESVESIDSGFGDIETEPVPGLPTEARRALEDAQRQIEAADASATDGDALPELEMVEGRVDGLQRGSFLTRAQLAVALERLAREGEGVRFLRVAPDGVDASVVSQGGRQTQFQVTTTGTRIVPLATASESGAPAVPIADVNPSAPYRLTAAAAERLDIPSTEVDYAVMLEIDGRQRWTVVYRSGESFSADRAGRRVRQNPTED